MKAWNWVVFVQLLLLLMARSPHVFGGDGECVEVFNYSARPRYLVNLDTGATLSYEYDWTITQNLSPDRRHSLQFTRDGSTLMLIDLYTDETRTISDRAEEPVWSGNGLKFAYRSDTPPGNQTLLLYDISSGISRPVAENVSAGSVHWSDDGLTGGGGFQVQIATDMNFGNVVFTSPILSAATLSYMLPAANALGWGRYYWRVNVLNYPSVSPIFRQFFVTPTPPAAPTLLSPASGTTVGTNTPILTWNSVTYAYGSLAYLIQVDNNTTFTSPEFTQSGINGTQAVTTPLASGTYYWRVRAVNVYGAAGAWSASRSFKVP